MKKNLLLLIAASFMMFTSCTKTDDSNNMKFENSGFIKGTIKGFSADSIKLNETFNFTSLPPLSKYSNTIEESTRYIDNAYEKVSVFKISRYSKDFGSITFQITTWKGSNTVLSFKSGYDMFELGYFKNIGSGKVLNYSVSTYDIVQNVNGSINSNYVSFKNFTYDGGVVRFDYSIGVETNGQNATIEGSVSSVVYEIVN